MKTKGLEGERRRVPLQDRSRQRVERILDAAARVFGDVGYEAATTEAIAERAGTSVGSIYQFFPNKRALFDAIATHCNERSRAAFDELVSRGPLPSSWRELMERSVDVFVSLNDEPGFRAIWKNWQVSADVFEAGAALNREIAQRTEMLMAFYAPHVPPPKRSLVATVVVEVTNAMLLLAARERRKAPEIAREAKLLLFRYLDPYARPRGRGPATRNQPRRPTSSKLKRATRASS